MNKVQIIEERDNYQNKINCLQTEFEEKSKDLTYLYQIAENYNAESTKMKELLEYELNNTRKLNSFSQIKMVSAYCEDMNNHLSGNKAQNFISNLDGMRHEIEQKIDDIEDRINSIKITISIYQNKVSECNVKINNLDGGF